MKTAECQTLIAQSSIACQTLEGILEPREEQCQTLSLTEIIDDYELDKKRREDEERRRLEKLRKEALRKLRRDLMQLFLNCSGLKIMLASEPTGASPSVISKWHDIGPLSVDFIL